MDLTNGGNFTIAFTTPNSTVDGSNVLLNGNETDQCEGLSLPIDVRKPWIALTFMYGFSAMELIGIPANILSFIVLRQDRSYSTTRTFLLYLTVIDTLILIVYFHYYVLKTVYDVHNYGFLEWVEYADSRFYVLSNIAKFVQIWLTVVISADRYYAIRNPLKAPLICTVKNARIACMIITVVSLLLNLPRWFRYYRVPVYCHNRTIFKFVESPLIKENFPQYELVYDSVLDPVLYYYVPLIALILLNTCLILSVRKASALRERMSSHAKNETGITMTLIAVVSTFILCETPTLMLLVMELCVQIMYFAGDEPVQSHVCVTTLEDETLLCISVLAVLVNSSINFFLYVLIGKKFRGILLNLLCPSRFKSLNESRSHVFTSMVTSVRSNYNSQLPHRKRESLADKDSSTSRLPLINDSADQQQLRRTPKSNSAVSTTSFGASSPSVNGHSLRPVSDVPRRTAESSISQSCDRRSFEHIRTGPN